MFLTSMTLTLGQGQMLNMLEYTFSNMHLPSQFHQDRTVVRWSKVSHTGQQQTTDRHNPLI